MSDVIDGILKRINIFYICTYKSLAFGAKPLEIIFVYYYQANEL